MFPALAVARVLRERDHQILFIGTREGMEARLVPGAGFPIEFVRAGGLNRVGWKKQLWSLIQLPLGLLAALRILLRVRPNAVFSMGGYVAGPVIVAALFLRLPLVIMEPNAIPGIANRKVAKRVYRALLGFESTRRWFPPDKSEVTGLPVRPEFFSVPPKSGDPFTVLITGGSRGSRTLNRASRESWNLFCQSGSAVRIIHQSGVAEHEVLAREFSQSGLPGEVVPFIQTWLPLSQRRT